MEHYEDYLGVPMNQFESKLDKIYLSELYLGNVDPWPALDHIEKESTFPRIEEVKPRDYHRGETLIGTMLPGTVGYNEGNCMQHVWGAGNRHTQSLLHNRLKHWASQMGFKTEWMTWRLLKQGPGHCVPWHVDSMQAHRDTYKRRRIHLVGWYERKLTGMSWRDAQLKSVDCSGYRLERHIVCLEDHQPGHIIQIGTQVITEWKAGDVFWAPVSVWHMTGNLGIVPRLSVTMTGVRPQ